MSLKPSDAPKVNLIFCIVVYVYLLINFALDIYLGFISNMVSGYEILYFSYHVFCGSLVSDILLIHITPSCILNTVLKV